MFYFKKIIRIHFIFIIYHLLLISCESHDEREYVRDKEEQCYVSCLNYFKIYTYQRSKSHLSVCNYSVVKLFSLPLRTVRKLGLLIFDQGFCNSVQSLAVECFVHRLGVCRYKTPAQDIGLLVCVQSEVLL